MPTPDRALAAAVCLLLVLGPACLTAQVTDPPPPDAAAPWELASEVAAPILALVNRPTTFQFSGRTRIPAGRTVGGDVAVLAGSLTLAGRIEGDVVVIDGDAHLLPGAEVLGDLTVVGGLVDGPADAAVRGEVVVHPERLRYRRSGDRVVLDDAPLLREPARPPDPDRWLARGDFLIATGRSYNRVEGLPVTFGPVIETAGSNPLRARALGIYRTESGATLDPDRLGYYLRAEQFLGGRRGLRVGGTLHSTVEPIEDRHVTDLENSLATFLLRRDFRDHYEREGGSLFATLSLPRRPWEVSLVGRWERHHALAAGSPWTLFRNEESWRPQPLAAEGRVRLLALEGRYDTRSSATDPSHGWYLTGSLERTLSSELERPEAAVAMPFPIVDPVLLPAERFAGWTHGLLDVRRYNRLSPDSRLNLRLLLAGSLDGAALPPQRQHALGGGGSLPGFSPFRLDCAARDREVYRSEVLSAPITPGRNAPSIFVPAYGCDQVALFQAEYRGSLSLRFGWGGDPEDEGETIGWVLGWASSPDWVAFVDAGRGWGVDRPNTDFALDLGFGLVFTRVGVYMATPLTGEGGVNLFVRLGPRF